MSQILSVNEIMEKNIKNKITITKFNNLKEMAFNNFVEGTLFIVDDKDNLIAVLTDGDVRRCYSTENHNIIDFLSNTPITISSNDTSSIALRILREHNINILPVLENNKLIGYITLHMLINNFSPERLYITGNEKDIDDNTERHLARYKFALNFIHDGYALDCACGSGYGSNIIAQKAKKVLGVDLSEEAIEFANSHVKNSTIQFQQNNIDNLMFEDSTFDNIISIETLEHVPNNVFLRFLDNVAKWLKPNGIFIGSSPMLRYKDGKPFITNPYHINEMPKDEFINAISMKLRNFEIHFYYQDQDTFLPLSHENTGFCIVIARKKQ